MMTREDAIKGRPIMKFYTAIVIKDNKNLTLSGWYANISQFASILVDAELEVISIELISKP